MTFIDQPRIAKRRISRQLAVRQYLQSDRRRRLHALGHFGERVSLARSIPHSAENLDIQASLQKLAEQIRPNAARRKGSQERWSAVVELFIANEGVVSLDELAACFPSTKNPRKRVPDIIHWLNQALAKHGIDLRVNRDVMFSVGRSTDPTDE